MSKASEAVRRSHAKLAGTPCAKGCGKPRLSNSSYCVEHRRAMGRRRNMRKRGVDADENTLELLVSKQGGICAICYGRPLKFHLDHDHKTGKVRGALCHRCNIMLGMALDSPSILEMGAAYLKR